VLIDLVAGKWFARSVVVEVAEIGEPGFSRRASAAQGAVNPSWMPTNPMVALRVRPIALAA